MTTDRTSRIGGWIAATAFAFALLLSAAPQLHERVHSNAAAPNHECAVTLLANGNCDHAGAPPVVVGPQRDAPECAMRSFHSAFVPSSFLGASIFEHAPPVLS